MYVYYYHFFGEIKMYIISALDLPFNGFYHFRFDSFLFILLSLAELGPFQNN